MKSNTLAAILFGATLSVAGVGAVLAVQNAEKSVKDNAEHLTESWARYLGAQFDDLPGLVAGQPLTQEDLEELEDISSFDDIFLFKLFAADGRHILTSENNDDHSIFTDLSEHNATAAAVVRTGKKLTEVKTGGERTDRPAVYGESYIPIAVDGTIIAVVEAYVDLTAQSKLARREHLKFAGLIGLVILAGMTVPGAALLWASNNLRRRNEELAFTRDKALIAEKAKSEFLANMSHEIRTPMNGVLGMAELLSGTHLDDRQRMFTDLIQTSGRALLSIINDILDFSKIDAGQLTLKEDTFRLSAIAHEPARLLAKAVADKGLEILVRIDPALPRDITGDQARIRQVVTNLLNNAVKFTEHGQIVVDVSEDAPTGSSKNDGDIIRLRVEVKDTGIGIASEALTTVFDKFSQVDSSSTRRHEGTGLGLAICKGLVELMGGEMGANSEPGVGSTFWFTLPLTISESSETAVPLPVEVADKRILVIDDNETNRYILHELLSSWNTEESSAASGREGVQKLITANRLGRPFDLVLLDHHMPGMNGEDVLKLIRGTADIADVPVILLSSMEDMAVDGQEERLRFQAALTKPVNSSQLFDTIISVLSAHGIDGPAPVADASAIRQIAGTEAPKDLHQDTDELQKTSDATPDVLIIEDNHVNQLVAQQILANLHLSHVTAENGEEGVTLYDRLRPDIVLMDVSMPVMNGYEATQQIRAIEAVDGPNARHACIIGLTAHALEGDKKKCLDAGMDHYLSKPVSAEALQDLIRDARTGPAKAAAES